VNPDHLFLGTNQDNIDDMVSKARNKRGENDANSKLTAEQVRAIRQSFATGIQTQVEIAAAFNVNKITVFDIVHRKTWKHID
jgi:DNA-binding transcriptional regulator YiaG